MKLYSHQKEVLKKNPKKILLAHECGTGKTLTSIKIIEQNKEKAMVVVPKSLVDQWASELEKHSNNHEDWLIITKETFRRDWNKLPKFNAIILEEAHFFFGMQGLKKKSAMLKAGLSYIKKHNPEIVLQLTATPYNGSNPWNIYAAGKILGREWDAKEFKEKFFNMVNMGMRWPVPVVKQGIENDIAQIIKNIGDVVKMADCFDVPEQVFQEEFFALSREQKKAIAELDDEGIARWTKIHQICGGTLKGDGYTKNQSFKSEKMDRVLELAQEHNKLIIVCRYNYEIKSISKKLNKSNQRVFIINGETKDKHREVKNAERRQNAICLIQAQASEGYELPSFPVMVFYSYGFSLKNYIQMKGRILRANKLKKNVYLSLVVKNTIDHDVFKCIQAKKDFDIAIYNK